MRYASFRREPLDQAVAGIGDVDEALAVDGDVAPQIFRAAAAAEVELILAAALLTPLGDVVSIDIEDLDAAIAGVEMEISVSKSAESEWSK